MVLGCIFSVIFFLPLRIKTVTQSHPCRCVTFSQLSKRPNFSQNKLLPVSSSTFQHNETPWKTTTFTLWPPFFFSTCTQNMGPRWWYVYLPHGRGEIHILLLDRRVMTKLFWRSPVSWCCKRMQETYQVPGLFVNNEFSLSSTSISSVWSLQNLWTENAIKCNSAHTLQSPYFWL